MADPAVPRNSRPSVTTAQTGIQMSTREFLLQALQAILALLLSGIALITYYLYFDSDIQDIRQAAAQNDSQDTRLIRGDELTMRLGAGNHTADGSLSLTVLALIEDDMRAIATRKTRFEAADFPLVRYHLSERHGGEFVYLIWRNDEEPDRVFYTPLLWDGSDVSTAMPAADAGWRGTITEIGVDVYGELRGKALHVDSLRLLPFSNWGVLQSTWKQWTAFDIWSQSSAHYLPGRHRQGSTHSLTTVMMLWAGGAIIGLLLWRRVSGRSGRACLVVAGFIPWLTLDQVWQHTLASRVADSHSLFHGKTMHQRHLADLEHDTYAYAQRLKLLLPEPGVKIQLLHDSPLRTYQRLKTQYYLFPHNTYNFDRYPRKESSRPGDYILILGDIPGLSYDEGQQQLQWHGNTMAAERLDTHPLGSLYRVKEGGT